MSVQSTPASRKPTPFAVTLTLLSAGMLMTACANGGDLCLTAEPIFVSDDDVLTTETARQILAHNEVLAALCES